MDAGYNERAGPPSLTVRAVPLVVGLTAAVAQIVFMREVIALFNGNELSLGILLAVWLAMTAIGSCVAGRIVPQESSVRWAIAAGECLSCISLPLAVWILRAARVHLQTVPGELLRPAPLAVALLAGLSGFCVVSGCLFALAVRWYRNQSAAPVYQAASIAYLLETVGFAAGGLLARFLLGTFSAFQIAFLAGLLNLWVACGLCFRTVRAQVAGCVISAAWAAALVVEVGPRLELITQRPIWAGFRIEGTAESVYGKLMVLEASGLRTIYENGAVLANVPDQAAAEEAVHYALLEHPAPRRVLLIGGGINGSVDEVLKHPTIEKLDYVELDPALIDIYRRHFPSEFRNALFDSRVKVHLVDGRQYLKTVQSAFDVVIICAPAPENAQLNRYYTVEFFQTVRSHLAAGGLIALQLRASEDSIAPDLADFLRCIHRTLRSVFPHVAVIPGDTLHMFGSVRDGTLTEDPRVLVVRLKQRGLQTQYVREYFIPYRMMPDRMLQVHELLGSFAAVPVNHDFAPVAYYFGTVLWGAQFKASYAQMLKAAAAIPKSAVIGAAGMLSLLLMTAWAFSPNVRVRSAAAWSVIATGYTLMALQILLLLAFQAVCGYVYYNLALLVGMFMSGISVGSAIGIRWFRCRHGAQLLRSAANNQFLLAIAPPLMLVLADQIAHASAAGGSTLTTQSAFAAMALLCGIPGGFQFPIASALYQSEAPVQPGTGTLYALDLAGGCIGALLLAGFLIPLFGFWTAGWTATVAAGAPAIAVAIARFNPEAGLARRVGCR